MGTLYQESALHRSLRLSMGGFCVSDYIKRFTVRDSFVLSCEPGLKLSFLDSTELVSVPLQRAVCLTFLARLCSLLACRTPASVKEVFLK